VCTHTPHTHIHIHTRNSKPLTTHGTYRSTAAALILSITQLTAKYGTYRSTAAALILGITQLSTKYGSYRSTATSCISIENAFSIFYRERILYRTHSLGNL
jgi:hypothetical protein